MSFQIRRDLRLTDLDNPSYGISTSDRIACYDALYRARISIDPLLTNLADSHVCFPASISYYIAVLTGKPTSNLYESVSRASCDYYKLEWLYTFGGPMMPYIHSDSPPNIAPSYTDPDVYSDRLKKVADAQSFLGPWAESAAFQFQIRHKPTTDVLKQLVRCHDLLHVAICGYLYNRVDYVGDRLTYLLTQQPRNWYTAERIVTIAYLFGPKPYLFHALLQCSGATYAYEKWRFLFGPHPALTTLACANYDSPEAAKIWLRQDKETVDGGLWGSLTGNAPLVPR